MSNRRDTPWIILIIGAGFLALSAWSIYRASHETSAVTDRDYYSHGLRYNETLLEKKAAETLGWTIDVTLTGRRLLAELRDKDGRPVDAATGTILIYEPQQGASRMLPMQEISSGRFALDLTDDLSGTINALVEFERSGARLKRLLLLNL
jgi:nitrogen fixation protein FixH